MYRVGESEEKVNKLAKEEVRKHQEETEEKCRRESGTKETMKKRLLKQQEEGKIRKQENLKVFVVFFMLSSGHFVWL
jgi:hypothetical protein